MVKRILPFLTILAIAVGCATLTKSEVTNLTPTSYPRNPNNLYSITAAFDTRQATIRKETIQGFVMVGTHNYPMQKTLLVPNRWETNVPIPAGQTNLYYRIKFVYDYVRIPERRTDSRLSPSYEVVIREK